MKIEMDSDGCIRIHPESQIDRYALRKWCDEFIHKNTSVRGLVIEDKIKYCAEKYTFSETSTTGTTLRLDLVG